MNLSKLLRNLVLGAVACLITVSFSLAQPVQSQPDATARIQVESAAGQAEPLTAQVTAQTMESSSQARYVAALTPDQVMPTAPSSAALGAAEAILMGNRLMLQGNFSNLSSPLRDYATDPLDPPNPNITSGVHIHQGESTENGPFQYALQVSSGASDLEGRFTGDYTLTPEQLQSLSSGKLYLDLHTEQNRAGELRGLLKPQ